MNVCVKSVAIIFIAILFACPAFADDTDLPHSALWDGRPTNPKGDAMMNNEWCIRVKARQLDDGISPASDIAAAIEASCRAKVQKVEKLYTENLSPQYSEMLKQKIENEQRQDAIKQVLENRQKKKDAP